MQAWPAVSSFILFGLGLGFGRRHAHAHHCWFDFVLIFVVWALFAFTVLISSRGVGWLGVSFVCLFIYFVILGRGVRVC